MRISRISSISKKTNSMDINMSCDDLARISDGESMMKIVPNLTLAECEFLYSGCTPNEMSQLN